MKSVHQDLSYSSPRFSRQGGSFLFTEYFFLFLFSCVCVCVYTHIYIYICPLFFRSSTTHLLLFFLHFFSSSRDLPHHGYHETISLVDRDLSLSFGTVLPFFFSFFFFFNFYALSSPRYQSRSFGARNDYSCSPVKMPYRVYTWPRLFASMTVI